MRDLGLNYEEAGHGIQSAIRFEMSQLGFPDDDDSRIAKMLKHVRVGLDMRAADHSALVELLIGKGVFSSAEYLEALRLAANEELARYQDHVRETYGLPEGTTFR